MVSSWVKGWEKGRERSGPHCLCPLAEKNHQKTWQCYLLVKWKDKPNYAIDIFIMASVCEGLNTAEQKSWCLFKNIQRFRVYKCWNADSNSGLLTDGRLTPGRHAATSRSSSSWHHMTHFVERLTRYVWKIDTFNVSVVCRNVKFQHVFSFLYLGWTLHMNQ